MKKVLTAALLCAVSAFATWDYFPIKPAGKGEVKIGPEFFLKGDLTEIGINARARFSVIEGLEIAALLTGEGGGFKIMSSNDGNDTEITGLQQPVIGLRYWLPMGLGIFVDVGLPVSGEKFEGATQLNFKPGVQFSTKFTEELALGSEVGVLINMENGDTKITPGMELDLGVELDYTIGSITPFVAVNVLTGLTKPQFDGNDAGDAAELGIVPSVGVIFAINEMLAADASVAFGIGEDRYGDDMPITINANIAVSF